jgi:hypothetical protein
MQMEGILPNFSIYMCNTCEVISPTAMCKLSTVLNIIQDLSITNSCFNLKFRFRDQHFVFLKYVLYVGTYPTQLILLEKNNWWQYIWISSYLCQCLHFLFTSFLLSPNMLPKILFPKQYKSQLSTICVHTKVPVGGLSKSLKCANIISEICTITMLVLFNTRRNIT